MLSPWIIRTLTLPPLLASLIPRIFRRYHTPTIYLPQNSHHTYLLWHFHSHSEIYCHAKQYDNDGACHNKRNGGKLHGNISRNGYGNAMIGRYGGCFEEQYGGCFEEGYIVVLWYRRKVRRTREASNGGRVRVRIIHGLNISHNELTYFLQKSISY